MAKFDRDFAVLREMWREIQGEEVRSEHLLALGADELVQTWHRHFAEHQASEVRRWYLTLYKEFMQGKSVLELGSGPGFLAKGSSKPYLALNTLCSIFLRPCTSWRVNG